MRVVLVLWMLGNLSVLARPVVAALWQEVESDRLVSAERLWDAARNGDATEIERLLAKGIPVDAPTPYGSTALCFASDRGHLEAVRILLNQGADPNVRDSFYKLAPLAWAQANRHYDVIIELLAHGAEGADDLLLQAVDADDLPLAKAVVESRQPTSIFLYWASEKVKTKANDDWVKLFEGLTIDQPSSLPATTEELQQYVGIYGMSGAEFQIDVAFESERLVVRTGAQGRQELLPLGDHRFYVSRVGWRITFDLADGKASSCHLKMGETTFPLTSVARGETPTEEAHPVQNNELAGEVADSDLGEWQFSPSPADALVSQVNWPGFRGTGARGVADGQCPPREWDATTGNNLLWKTQIAGLGNSCPVIWGDNLFVTTASSESANRDVRIGLYGNVDSVDDDSIYEFSLICLNKRTGERLWTRTVHTGKPAVKRHSKSSHANPTVATDGVHVVSFFGSEGLFCHDFEGQLLWRKDLGLLDSGWFLDAGYQWGFGSSPTIFEDRVIVQCDVQHGSFVAAFDVATGRELWRTERDEIPTWPSPIVHSFGDVPMLITHGTRAARGYDVRDGQLLWTLAGHSEIVVPTPFVAHDLIYLASGYAPVQPIVALRPEARGELTLLSGVASDPSALTPPSPIVWNTMRGGPYMPTPIVYGDLLYVCSNNGILTCYEALSGTQVYKERIKVGGTASFTASLVAADGHIYATAEDGRTAVIRAGRRYRLVVVNSCGENVLATPAISEGVFYVRSTDSLIAFADREAESGGLEMAPRSTMSESHRDRAGLN